IKYREQQIDGLAQAPQALIGLLKGENFGKVVINVAAEE
ncbi:TPA: NADP-dependent oxidoreductase, partial [Klebsiella aerogenes]|nr:NADP-dependent oxidoreductase [Klebsiella aerogenes]